LFTKRTDHATVLRNRIAVPLDDNRILAAEVAFDRADKRVPVPDEQAQAKALKVLEEVFGSELRKAKTAARAVLSSRT